MQRVSRFAVGMSTNSISPPSASRQRCFAVPSVDRETRSVSSRVRSNASSSAVRSAAGRSLISAKEKAIRSKLAADPQTKAASLDISARDGVVLLQGTVATEAMKQKAISLARQGEGVVQVIDRITVKK